MARDNSWNEIRAHIEGRRPLSSPRTDADRFEGLRAEADRRADERFLSAEASGRLAQRDDAITERKQAEEVLLKAGALQRAIFNSANFSSIATDAHGVIQIFNVGLSECWATRPPK
jgi:PAS domain-containing protein